MSYIRWLHNNMLMACNKQSKLFWENESGVVGLDVSGHLYNHQPPCYPQPCYPSFLCCCRGSRRQKLRTSAHRNAAVQLHLGLAAYLILAQSQARLPRPNRAARVSEKDRTIGPRGLQGRVRARNFQIGRRIFPDKESGDGRCSEMIQRGSIRTHVHVVDGRDVRRVSPRLCSRSRGTWVSQRLVSKLQHMVVTVERMRGKGKHMMGRKDALCGLTYGPVASIIERVRIAFA